MMACAQAKRPMAYYTFKDNDIRDDVNGIYNLLARYNVTVGKSTTWSITSMVSRKGLILYTKKFNTDKKKISSKYLIFVSDFLSQTFSNQLFFLYFQEVSTSR